MLINAGQAPLLRTDELEQRRPGALLSCQQARTIASWWQAPGAVGSALATLASTGMADTDALLSDILSTLKEPYATSAEDQRDLCDLYAWTVWHSQKTARRTLTPVVEEDALTKQDNG